MHFNTTTPSLGKSSARMQRIEPAKPILPMNNPQTHSLIDVSRKHRAGGFTLTELLVVIAIVATLAAISVVGIGRFRNSALMTKSTGNLRQIHLLAAMYSADNNQKLMPAKTAAPTQQWQWIVATYMGRSYAGIWDFVDQQGYKPEVDILVAPEWTKAAAYDKNRFWQTGYGMNMLPGLPSDSTPNTEESPDWGRSFRLDRITAQSTRAFIFTWPEWNAYYSEAAAAKGAFLDGKLNVLFFDGHVETKRPKEFGALINVPAARAK